MSIAGKVIAITRPEGQAKKITTLLEEDQAKTIHFPLIAIAPLSDYTKVNAQFSQLDQIDRLIFISSNAVHHAWPLIESQWPEGLPQQLTFAAIGPVTAQTLASYGVKQVLIPQSRFDSEALLALDDMQSVSQQKIMIVRGVGGREVLAQTLTQRGAIVSFAECYQRVNPQDTITTIYDHETQAPKCDALVVTSSEAMRHLVALVKIESQNADQHWLNKVKVCVNLPRVAEALNNLGLKTYIAGKPGDEAMLNCLHHAFSDR